MLLYAVSSIIADQPDQAERAINSVYEYANRIASFISHNPNEFVIALSAAATAFFTLVLAARTSGLFKETAGLREETAVLAKFAKQQAEDMKDSIAAAQMAAKAAEKSADTLARTERAQIFIVIESQNISGETQSMKHYALSHSQGMKHGGKWRVHFRFKNYGKTPAVIKQISRFISHAVDLPEKIDYWPVDTVLKENVIAANGQTEPLDCEFSGEVAGPQANEIARGQRTIWFYGRVLYDDAIGQEHEHRFIWRCNGGSHGFRPADHPEHSKNT